MSPELRILISADQLQKRIEILGKEISAHYGEEKVEVICVLRGAFIFAADLVRRITSPLEIHFLRLSSYEGKQSSGLVKSTLPLSASMNGKNVLVVEDIVDTGKTLDYLRQSISEEQPKSLKICSLLSKPECHETEVHVDFQGFGIENRFVVGYGLDYDGAYRQLPYLAELKL